MNLTERSAQILAELTPERLGGLIQDLAAQQPPARRSDVSLPTILDALAQGADLFNGAEGWAAKLELTKAIRDLVGRIPDMRYVEGDA